MPSLAASPAPSEASDLVALVTASPDAESRSPHRHRHHPLAAHAWAAIARRAARSFVLAWGVKAGVALLLKLVALARRRKGVTLASAIQGSLLNPGARRMGLFFGLFTLLFHATARALSSTTLRPRAKGFAAGFVAALALAIEDRGNRLMFAQQFSMRALQAIYNGLKHRNLFHFPLGDSLLFVLSSAQIMYSYTHYPSVLPREYYGFMIKMAKIPAFTLEQNRTISRTGIQGPGLDISKMYEWIKAKYPRATPHALKFVKTHPSSMAVLPCEFIHPESNSCTSYNMGLFKHVLMNITPVYFALHFVPAALLRTKSVLKSPKQFMSNTLHNTARSGIFLATFVTVYQLLICVHRGLALRGIVRRDHRFLYFFYGLINSLAILIEAKKRRSELGMYVAPKAIHALYQVATDHKRMMPRLPFADVVVFAFASGTIMSFFAEEPDRLSPMILRVLPKFIR